MTNTDQTSNPTLDKAKCKHTKIWIISGGSMLWCYQCGAIRPNVAGSRSLPIKWQVISTDGKNPAMVKNYPAQSWHN